MKRFIVKRGKTIPTKIPFVMTIKKGAWIRDIYPFHYT